MSAEDHYLDALEALDNDDREKTPRRGIQSSQTR